MPRVENTGQNVSKYCEESGEGSSTYDVCGDCYDGLQCDPNFYNEQLTPYNGDPQGDEGWTGDANRPPYDDDDYECAVCGVHLTEENAG